MSIRSRTWAADVGVPQKMLAAGEGRLPFIHEAEERTKKKFLEISVGFEISKKIN